jgi:hypothetical protein
MIAEYPFSTSIKAAAFLPAAPAAHASSVRPWAADPVRHSGQRRLSQVSACHLRRQAGNSPTLPALGY